MEWSNELIFEFLQLYQNEPTLWNVISPEHKNKFDAYDAWNRIKNNLRDGSITIPELKKKRDNLMSTYRRQTKKIRESIRTGGADEAFVPEWPFYSTMATFLDDVYKPRKRKSSEESLDTEDIKEKEEDTSVDDASEQGSTSKIKLPKKQFKKRKFVESDERKKHRDSNSYKEVYDPDTDTCSLYCKLLCNKLRALQENTRDIAMMEIDRIMYDLKQNDRVIKDE